MPDIKAYVGKFLLPLPPTTGSFNVTGIVDSTGASFTPKVIIIWGARDGKVEDTSNQMRMWDLIGFDDGINHCGSTIGSRWFAGSVWASGSGGGTQYSIVTVDGPFSAHYNTKGYVSTLSSGGFTYTLDLNNDVQNMSFNFLALGGADLLVKVGTITTAFHTSTVITGVGFQPTGGLFTRPIVQVPFADGLQIPVMGFAGADLTQYAMCSPFIPNGGAFTGYAAAKGVIRSGYIDIGIENLTDVVHLNTKVTSWDSNGFTVLNSDINENLAYCVFGGVNFKVGTFQELATNGNQTVDLGLGTSLVPVFALFGSTGRVPNTADTLHESWTVGAYDGHRARAYLHTGQDGSSPSGNGGADWGADSAMLFGQSNGYLSSALIEKGILTPTKLDKHGFTGSWTATDGVQREIIYFTTGVPPPPPIPNTGLYKIDPGRTNDEYYLTYDPPTTHDTAIPEPTADIYLIGDE